MDAEGMGLLHCGGESAAHRFGLVQKQQPDRLRGELVLKCCQAHRIPAWSPQQANKVDRFHPDKVTVAALIYLLQRPKRDNSQRPSIG